MRKYWAIARAGFLNSLVYRADTIIWGFGELIDTLVFLFILLVIYGEKNVVGGFTLPETITYMIGTGLIASFLYSWVGPDIERDVQGGDLSNILLKPINYSLARGAMGIGNRPLSWVVRIVVYTCLAFFFKEKFIFNTNFLSWFLLFLCLVLAYFIYFLTDFLFGCIAFWTTTTRGPMGVSNTIRSILSGAYAPLTFFPLLFQTVASLLPFAYTRYFPMLIYLNKLTTIEIIKGLGIQVFWIMVLLFLTKKIWRRGLRRYEGVGI